MRKILQEFLLLLTASSLAFLLFGSGAPNASAQAGPGESSGHGLLLASGFAADIQEPGSPSPSRMGITVEPVTGCIVRVAYIIPSNRTAQTNAVANLRTAIFYYESWYREEMQKHGFGPKTFRYETEPDAVTPRIYTVPVNVTDDYLRGDLWGRTISAASAAGIPTWASRQVWLLVPEAHLMGSDGSITGGTALGASFGSGDDAGIAMVGSDALARMSLSYLTNNTRYAGRVVPDIGSYALVQDVSFPWFEGQTFSSVSSSVFGAGVHETSHAFGLPHDFRNDQNFNGNLMGNGLRGIRGNWYPAFYPADYTRLSYAAALGLSVSRYFNPVRNYPDNTKPSLIISTRGTNTTVNGLLQIAFRASDSSGLHCAWLQLNGDLISEMPLSGTTTNVVIHTALYNPGASDKYTVSVFDTQGNKQAAETTILVALSTNRAPQPTIAVTPPVALVGQSVKLDASRSTDPGGTASLLKIEWDLDGDSVFDTAPSTVKTVTRPFNSPGDYLIRARLTDPSGASAESTPIALRVIAPTLTVTRAGDQLQFTWPAAATGFFLQSTLNLNPSNWTASELSPVLSGSRWMVTFTNPPSPSCFRLAR